MIVVTELDCILREIHFKCQTTIHAEVVTRVAGSLEAGGLPGYPESLVVEINMMKWFRPNC